MAGPVTEASLSWVSGTMFEAEGDGGARLQIDSPLAKGGSGLGFILTTDDCRGTYEELKAKGVEFSEEPTERDYGIDCGFRDPFGNQIRLTQPSPD